MQSVATRTAARLVATLASVHAGPCCSLLRTLFRGTGSRFSSAVPLVLRCAFLLARNLVAFFEVSFLDLCESPRLSVVMRSAGEPRRSTKSSLECDIGLSTVGGRNGRLDCKQMDASAQYQRCMHRIHGVVVTYSLFKVFQFQLMHTLSRVVQSGVPVKLVMDDIEVARNRR